MKFRLCILVSFLLAAQFQVTAQVPLLNSLPGSPYVVLLDFDGHVVNGTTWNSGYNNGNPINCIASGFNSTQITQAFNIVSEDYRPFNMNVTTDSTVFAAAPSQQKVRVVITKSSSWYPSTVGGVALLNSFSSPVNNICFVFNNNLSNNASYTAEACSHEAGHTFSLSHHSDYNSSCVKQSDYLQGYGSGETGWAPIMGVGYYRNMTTWSNIAADFGCDYAQDDLAKITASYNRGVAYRTDDHGDNNASATALTITAANFSDSGLISTNTDLDVFKLTLTDTSYVTIDAVPWNYGSPNTKANLDILLLLKNDAGDTIHLRDPSTTLNASLSNVLLMPGNYYIYIDGTANNNQSGYGSLGKYYLSGTVNDAVGSHLSAGFIASDTNICKGSAIHFTTQSTGNITGYTWSFPGGMPSSATTKDPGFIAYNNAGTHSVTLTVSDGVGNVAKTLSGYIRVNNLPTISTTPSTPAACGNMSAEILASGANYYKWSPTTGLNNSTLSRVKATVSSETTYTVTGTDNNGCTSSADVTVKHFAAPVLTRTPSDAKVYNCEGDSVLLSVSGAYTYAWSPATCLSDSTGATVKAGTPLGNTFYVVMATDSNGCKSSTSFNITTRNCDTIAADFMVDKTGICAGACINFKDFSTGYPDHWNWSFPGGNPSTSTEKDPGLVCYSTPGTYAVTLDIISGGVTSSKTTNNFISVGTMPQLNIVSSASLFCIGDSATLTVTGAQSYQWESHPTLTYVNGTSVKVRPIVNTSYYVTGTIFGNGNIGGSGNGEYTRCQQRDSFRMNVVNCVLPVKFLYFKAAEKNNYVNTTWAFAQQDEVDYYKVERSIDGTEFTGLEPVAKNTSGIFSYDDRKLPEAVKSLYYRLKWINYDRRSFYSPVVKVDIHSNVSGAVTVSPNPVSGVLTIKINSPARNKGRLTLKNAVGIVVQNKEMALQAGINMISLDMAALPGGIYFLDTRSAHINTVIKLVKR